MTYIPHLPPSIVDWGARPDSKGGSPILEKTVTAVTRGLAREIDWRVENMRKQVPSKGAVPDLIAREGPIEPGTCFSCGDPLKGSQRYRCRPCAVAAAIAIWGNCPEDIAVLLAQDEVS